MCSAYGMQMQLWGKDEGHAHAPRSSSTPPTAFQRYKSDLNADVSRTCAQVMGRRTKRQKGAAGGKGSKPKHREWVLKKKGQMRRRGYEVAPDTKYTGRKRKRLI